MKIYSPLIKSVLNVTGSGIITGSLTTTGDLLPAGTTQNLGSISNPWKEIFVTTGSINIVDQGEILKSLTVDNVLTTDNLDESLPAGLVSGSTQLTASLDERYILSGSLTQATWENITGKPEGIVSSSAQLTSSFDERYVLSGSITQTTWDNIDNKPAGIISSSTQLNDSTLAGMTISGSFSGSFQGDGSGLTGLSVNIETQTTVFDTFTTAVSAIVNHLLDTDYPLVQVYNSENEQIIPKRIKILNSSSVQVDFSTPETGYVVVAKGGHIVSGTAANALLLETQPGSYYLDYSNFTNVPAGIISGSSQLTASLDQRYVLSGSLTQTTWENITGKPAGIVSSSVQIQLNQISGTTFSASNFTFPEDLTVQGKLTAQEFYTELISSSIIYESGSTKFGDSLDDIHSFTGSLEVFGGITGSLKATNGIVSSSAQLTSSLDERYILSGSLTQTTWENITGKPEGIVSGSSQLNNSTLSGMTITGSFTGSFAGDGSAITGVTASVDEITGYAQTFTSVTSVNVGHNLNTTSPIVQVYNASNRQFLPEIIEIVDNNTVQVTFSTTSSGKVVVAKGGHIVQGTSENALELDGEQPSFYLDYNNFTNVPAGIISGSAQLNDSTLTGMTISGSFSGSFQGDGSGLTNTGISTSELYAHSFLLMGG